MSKQISRCDSHVHVFLPDSHPYNPRRTYTPGPADLDMLEAHLDRLQAQKVVIVQPSPYGSDNSATLEALRGLGRGRARAIAVVDPDPTENDMVIELESAGVRGLRANFKTSGQNAGEVCTAQLNALDQMAIGTDLALEIFAPIGLLHMLRQTLAGLGRPVILDHFAGLKTGSPNLGEDLQKLEEILALPNIVLKLSGACRATNYAGDTLSLNPIAPSLISMSRGRAIWGSDWPHTGKSSERPARPLTEIEPFQVIDDLQSLADLEHWAGSPEILTEILWDTPGALFGF